MQEEFEALSKKIKETLKKYNLSYCSAAYVNGFFILNAENGKSEKCVDIFIPKEE